MSRIGNKPVAIPAGVEINQNGSTVSVKGPKGQLQEEINKAIKLEVKDGQVLFTRPSDKREERAQHGLTRTLVNNMVKGVTDGYEKKLELVGVGYRAEKKGNMLVMNLGFSHPVEMKDPEGITTECPSDREIVIKGIDKASVGNYAANIRSLRKPEPYKGKGVKYSGEYIRRKEGKTGAKAE